MRGKQSNCYYSGNNSIVRRSSSSYFLHHHCSRLSHYMWSGPRHLFTIVYCYVFIEFFGTVPATRGSTQTVLHARFRLLTQFLQPSQSSQSRSTLYLISRSVLDLQNFCNLRFTWYSQHVDGTRQTRHLHGLRKTLCSFLSLPSQNYPQ